MFEVSTVLEGIEAIGLAERFGLIDKLVTFFKKPQNIVVLGATGTGKSNFLATIQGIESEIFDAFNRSHIRELHQLKISKFRFNFYDTPGHQANFSERINAIREALRQHRIGIINVVSYGYHDYDVIETTKIINKAGVVKDSFLHEHRKDEISLLSEWMPLLGANESDDFLITLMTKADIWWDIRKEVERYYTSGDYGAVIRRSFHGKSLTMPYCSILKPYLGVVSPSKSFSDVEKQKLRKQFCATIVKCAAS